MVGINPKEFQFGIFQYLAHIEYIQHHEYYPDYPGMEHSYRKWSKKWIIYLYFNIYLLKIGIFHSYLDRKTIDHH